MSSTQVWAHVPPLPPESTYAKMGCKNFVKKGWIEARDANGNALVLCDVVNGRYIPTREAAGALPPVPAGDDLPAASP